MNTIKNGQCLCGAIKFQTEFDTLNMVACHCSTCRKWTAGPFMALETNTEPLYQQGEESVQIYASSEWAERGFCKHCGTSLFYRFKQDIPVAKRYGFPVWLFEETEDVHFELQVFTNNKPHCYTFANQTQQMTEEDILKLI